MTTGHDQARHASLCSGARRRPRPQAQDVGIEAREIIAEAKGLLLRAIPSVKCATRDADAGADSLTYKDLQAWVRFSAAWNRCGGAR